MVCSFINCFNFKFTSIDEATNISYYIACRVFKRMTFQRSLLTNILGIGVYKYTGEILTFLSSLIVSRYLTPEDFGTIAMVTLFYSFLTRLSDNGLSDAIIREENPEFGVQAQILFLVKGGSLCILMTALSFPIAWFFKNDEILFIGLCYALFLFLYSLPKTKIAVLRKQQLFVVVSRVELIVVCTQITLTVFLAIAGFSYWSLIVPHFVTPFMYLLLLKPYNKVTVWPVNFKHLKYVWGRVRLTIFNIGTTNFILYWQARIDKLWIGRIYGGESLGLFNRAFSLATLPVLLILPQLTNVLLPRLSSCGLSATEVKIEITQLHSFLFSIYYFPFVIFFLYPVRLSVVLWGGEWAGVGEYLGLLSLAFYWLFFIQSTHSLYLHFKKENMLMVQTIATGVVQVVLVTIGAFISLETMIYLYLFGLFIFIVPAVCYFGFVKSFGFKVSELLKAYGVVYGVMLFLLICKFLKIADCEVFALSILGLYSLVNLSLYCKKIIGR